MLDEYQFRCSQNKVQRLLIKLHLARYGPNKPLPLSPSKVHVSRGSPQRPIKLHITCYLNPEKMELNQRLIVLKTAKKSLIESKYIDHKCSDTCEDKLASRGTPGK